MPNNMVLDYHYGDTAKVDEAFAKAAHVDKARHRQHPRRRGGDGAARRRWRLRQGERALHPACADPGRGGQPRACSRRLLKVPNDKVRILTANVGGSFGMKNVNYPEYICILHASKVLGRPVKWTDERSEQLPVRQPGPRQRDALPNSRSMPTASSSPCASTATAMSAPIITGVMPSPLSLGIAKNIASVYNTPLLERGHQDAC